MYSQPSAFPEKASLSLDEYLSIGFYSHRYLSKRNLRASMSKRNTPQRRHNILALLNEQGEVSVDELAKRFETSEVTVRKDLAALESNGLLLRRYGGAVPMPQELIGEPGQPVSRHKQAIARAAVKRIREHARIIIDSGSTTAAMIPELGQQPGLVVMTNSLHVANALGELEHEPVLLMTGGTWDPHSESFQGQVAEQVLRSYDFDQLFIGADGIDLMRGTTTFNELLGLSRVMAEVAREVIVMVEADKVGRKIPNLELPWSSVHTLITDDRLPQEARDHIQARGVTLICAAVS
jgi:DeoR/GlpR family transcriptional regulator of sugar metabolism